MDMKSKVSPDADDNKEPNTVLGYPNPNSKQPPPGLHYPGGGYPHPGYPPPYAAGPPGYPNMGQYQYQYQYQYSPSMQNYYNAPPHPGYYNSTQLPPNFGEYDQEPDKMVARAILCLLLFLILVTATVCLVVSQLLIPSAPTFDVAAFSVPAFNVSDTSLAGKFEATIAVENDECGVDLGYDHVEAMVSYDDYLLANKVVEPFELKKSSKVLLQARLETPATHHLDGGGGAGDPPPFKSMKSEHDSKGSLTFGIMLDGILSYDTNTGKRQQIAFSIKCIGLKTLFKDPGNVGVWDGVKPACVMHKK